MLGIGRRPCACDWRCLANIPLCHLMHLRSRRLIHLGLLDTLPAPPVEPSRLVVVALVQLSLLDVCWRLTSEPPCV